MTAKDYIQQNTPYSELPEVWEVKSEILCRTMDDFAKKQAVEFAQWIWDNGYVLESSGWNDGQNDKHGFIYFTTEQLYEQFLIEKL